MRLDGFLEPRTLVQQGETSERPDDSRARLPHRTGGRGYASDATTRAKLNPLTRISGFAGLEYTFDP